MSSKRFKELENLSKDELVTMVRELEASLFQAKMKKVTGQLSDTAAMWKVRKEIARIKTIRSRNLAEQRSK